MQWCVILIGFLIVGAVRLPGAVRNRWVLTQFVGVGESQARSCGDERCRYAKINAAAMTATSSVLMALVLMTAGSFISSAW